MGFYDFYDLMFRNIFRSLAKNCYAENIILIWGVSKVMVMLIKFDFSQFVVFKMNKITLFYAVRVASKIKKSNTFSDILSTIRFDSKLQ